MDLQEVIDEASKCRQCELHVGRNVPVFSKGNAQASIMVCGMCPGPEENKCGIPFVGRAGKLLDEILSDAKITLEDVYITNIVKCFVQPGTPLKEDWILPCLPYFINEISIVQPRVIITLGADASRALLNKSPDTPLFKMRNKIYHYTHSIDILSTYHPSYFIRNGGRKHIHYNRIIEDFNLALNIIRGGL
jgi:DNA polymerase